MTGQRVLVAGASGYVGREVVRDLQQHQHIAIAAVRAHNADRRPDQNAVEDALGSAERVDLALQDAVQLRDQIATCQPDVIVSCLASRSGVASDAWRIDHDANLALLEAALATGVRRFVLLSAICVQKPKLAFQKAKLKFEQALSASGIEFAIVRPTAFYKSIAGQVARVQKGQPFLLFGDGRLTAAKPISQRDLARFINQQVEAATSPDTILPIGGPEAPITPRQQGELLFEITGKPARFRSVTPRILSFAGAVLTPPGRLSSRIAAGAELARIGHYYATESMLLWDNATQRYLPDATPGFGQDTLREFYQNVLQHGLAGHEPGHRKLFSAK
ncbi:MAG: NAD(P)H-binding protein [Gammaproteobacteria bacterium]